MEKDVFLGKVNMFLGKGKASWEKEQILGKSNIFLGKAPEAPRMPQEAPEGPHEAPKEPEKAFGGPQEAPGDSRRLQEAPGCPRKPHFKAMIKNNSSTRPVLEPDLLECIVQNIVV